MAKTVLLEEQTFTSGAHDTYGYCYLVQNVPFQFAVDTAYTVVWDGKEYKCNGLNGSSLSEGSVFIGNATNFGLSGNDEPFAMGILNDGNMIIVCLTDTAPTDHTLAIYQGEEENAGADIVIRDRNGNEVTYEGVEKVKFNTTDGGTQLYSIGDTVENVPVDLDFSKGDQTVEAPSGYLVKSAVIAKPETLTPENIRKGETVAGVTGTLPAYTLEDKTVELDFSGGDMTVTPEDGKTFGGVNIPQPETLIPENIAEGVDIAGILGLFKGKAAISAGKFYTPTSDPQVIEHGLGVKPDFFMFMHQLSQSGKNIKSPGWAMSTALYNIVNSTGGFFHRGQVPLGSAAGSSSFSNYNIYLDGTGSGTQVLQCDEETITMGNSDYGLMVSSSYPYFWFAIGGLT